MSRCRVMQLGNPTGLYGAERWILALVRHLDSNDVESIVGIIRDDPTLNAPLAREAQAFGVKAHVFEAPGKVNLAAVSQVREFILANDVHVLHTHGYKTDLIGLLATRRTPCRLVSTPHGWSVHAGWKLRLYEGLDRAIFPFFDAVVPLSETMFEELNRLRGVRRHLKLIRNGVDLAEVDATGALAAEASRWKAENRFVVGYIGQLIPRKGLDVLLEAFARLAEPRKMLAIVGEGPQRAELEALVGRLGLQEQVAFLGFREDRLALLKGFDVFVLPSRLEGIPRCLMESMAARVAVIASDIPGCRDLVEHGKTGLLFPVDDAGALLEAITQCVAPAVRERLGRCGRELILERYSAAAMARQYLLLYRQLTGALAGREHASDAV